MNQGVRTTDSATFSGLTVNGQITPRSPASRLGSGAGVQISAGATYTLPRGIFMVRGFGTTSVIAIEITEWDGTWRGGVIQSAVAVISDGANVRLRNTSGSISWATVLRF